MDDKRVTDETFFKTLKNYSSIFYLGKGSAIFLINSKWQTSFITVVSSCIAYGISIWFLFKSGYQMKQQEQNSPIKTFVLYVINVFMLIGLILTFLLTQFLNPGIRNPHSISEQEFKLFGKKFCYKCEKEVHQKMYHCKQCQICIQNKDHHCMFFQKCMGGYVQRKCFCFFLLFASLSCVTLFVTLIFYLI